MLNKDKTVKTIDGSTQPREKCRKISGEFYLIGDPKVKDSGQCYLLNGTYFRYASGNIEYDHAQGTYVTLSNNNLVNGVVGIDKNGRVIYGYFTPNELDNIVVKTPSGSKTGLNEEIFGKSRYYRERLTDGVFYRYDAIPAKNFSFIDFPDQGYKNSLQYTCDNSMPEYIKFYNNNYKPKELYPMVRKYGDFAEDYTFGVEFETVRGSIPTRICKKYGLIPVRDGSVMGLEYVTIPLQGKLGLNTLIDVSRELSKRTVNDKSCSMHIHIGNIPRTQSFLLAFYKLVASIQDEIFEMFPIYKRVNYGIKKKNYTKPLPISILTELDPVINKSNMTKNFDVLFKFLSMGSSFSENFKTLSQVKQHPSDPNGTSKWNIKSRYYHVNMIPIVFGNKKTIEFRIHTGTDDANKIINFLSMWISIINFVKNNQTLILSKFDQINGYSLLNYISNGIDSSVASSTMAYVKTRKRYIASCIQRGDVMADENEFDFNSSIDWAKRKKDDMFGYKYISKSRNPFGSNMHMQGFHDAVFQSMMNDAQQTNIDSIPTPVPAPVAPDTDNQNNIDTWLE